MKLRYRCAPTRTTTPPSGVSVRTESRRTHFNCSVVRFHQLTEKAPLFESVSISMKGGWKETRGVQRLILAKSSVSESRMVSLNPFETKRKKDPLGTSSRVCDVQVAEGVSQTPNSLGGALRVQMMFGRTSEQTLLSHGFVDTTSQAHPDSIDVASARANA